MVKKILKGNKMFRTNQHTKPKNICYVTIEVSHRGARRCPAHIRTKVALDTEPVDSHLGNAILQAIAASGFQLAATGAVVTLSFS